MYAKPGVFNLAKPTQNYCSEAAKNVEQNWFLHKNG